MRIPGAAAGEQGCEVAFDDTAIGEGELDSPGIEENGGCCGGGSRGERDPARVLEFGVLPVWRGTGRGSITHGTGCTRWNGGGSGVLRGAWREL